MAEIIFGAKTIDDLLPYVCNNWSTAKKLYNLSPYDFRTFSTNEFSIFEHVFLYKFWYKILEQSLKRKLHEDLYRDILEKA